MSVESASIVTPASALPLIVVMSGVPLGNRARYALAARMNTLASDLSHAGFDVLLVAPNGTRITGPGAARTGRSIRSLDRPNPNRYETVSTVLGDALKVFVRALVALRPDKQTRPVVLLSTGVWVPFFARMLVALHERMYLHLDVPGIPHTELALSRPRFWRGKVGLYAHVFSTLLRHSAVITTINESHARFLRDHFGIEALVVPDLLNVWRKPTFVTAMFGMRSGHPTKCLNTWQRDVRSSPTTRTHCEGPLRMELMGSCAGKTKGAWHRH